MSEGITAYLQKLGERPNHDLRETVEVRRAEAFPSENACQAIVDGKTIRDDLAVAGF
jgi:hypothetical protein